MNNKMYSFNLDECEIIKDVLVKLREETKKLKLDEELYSIIPLHMMCKRKILITNLIFHPICMKTKLFFEPKNQVKDLIELKKILFEVIQFELNSDLNDTRLKTSELNQVIQEHKKLVAYEKRQLKKKEKEKELQISVTFTKED